MSKSLTDTQIEQAARVNRVEVAALRAVIEVESGGNGFATDQDGNPCGKLLFEPHVPWKRRQIPGRGIDPRPLAKVHPDLCGPSWNPKKYPYGPTRSQWDRANTVFLWAQKVDRDRWESYKKAAYESCSYG